MNENRLIEDKVGLRQVAMTLATETLKTIGCYANGYDINNHLAIAKAIENYIKGDAELPEYKNTMAELMNAFEKNRISMGQTTTPINNFDVNEL